jgi:hypothetical protein
MKRARVDPDPQTLRRDRGRRRRGRRPRTPEEWGARLIAEYQMMRQACEESQARLDKVVRKSYGVRFRGLPNRHPAVWRAVERELRRASWRSGRRLRWSLRSLGVYRLITGLAVSPPWEIAVMLVALQHGLSTRRVWRYLCLARSRCARERSVSAS